MAGAIQNDPALSPHGDGSGEASLFVIAALVTVALAIVPSVMWAGAASWSNDEPMLLIHAWSSNHAHRLADRGLSGAFPVPYGPLPTHFYQLLLLFTNDLRAMVVIRATLCSALLAGSLLWLARLPETHAVVRGRRRTRAIYLVERTHALGLQFSGSDLFAGGGRIRIVSAQRAREDRWLSHWPR